MKRAGMVATCMGTTLAVASIAAGTDAAGSASAPRAEGSPDLSGQVARSVVKAPTQKRFARHESKKCHERLREDWAAFRAAFRVMSALPSIRYVSSCECAEVR